MHLNIFRALLYFIYREDHDFTESKFNKKDAGLEKSDYIPEVKPGPKSPIKESNRWICSCSHY